MGWQTESVVQLIAGNTIINASGTFTYSSAPAAGNLIASQTPASGADTFGNNYLQGNSAYGAAFASSLNGGFLTLYTGSLSGGWTAQATIETDVSGDILIVANREVSTANNTLDDGSGNMAVAGGLTVGGTNQTSTATGSPVTSGPNGGVFAGHTHDFAGHTHTL